METNMFKVIGDVIKLVNKPGSVYLDEVPEILQDDFKQFLIGKTIASEKNGRIEVYDIKAYYHKLRTTGMNIKIIKGYYDSITQDFVQIIPIRYPIHEKILNNPKYLMLDFPKGTEIDLFIQEFKEIGAVKMYSEKHVI